MPEPTTTAPPSPVSEPVTIAPPSPVEVTVPNPAAFAAAVRAALVAAGAARGRGPQFTNVLIESTTTGMRFSATDSYRLHITELDLPDPGQVTALLGAGFVAPASELAVVATRAAARHCPPLTVGGAPAALTFAVGDETVRIRRAAHAFPSLASIDLGATAASVPVWFGHRFLTGVARAAALVDPKGPVRLESLAPSSPTVWRAENPATGVRLCAVVAAVRPPEPDRPFPFAPPPARRRP